MEDLEVHIQKATAYAGPVELQTAAPLQLFSPREKKSLGIEGS